MAKCDICGKEESMPYQCRHCGGTYCGDHRLPESHNCPVVKQWEEHGKVFDSTFDDSVGGSGTQKAGMADRFGLDTGPGGPLAYLRGNMTYIFLGLMWITFAAQVFLDPILTPSTWEAIFVFSPDNPFYAWTWVTSIFAHGSILHIVFNSIVVFFFGRLVEQVIGWKKFGLLFILSGILAGFGQVGTNLLLFDGGPGVVGASGAALALLGLLTVIKPDLTVYLYFVLPLPIWVISGGTVAISLLFLLTGQPGAGGIAHVAHLVGVLVGLAYGYRIRSRVRVPGQYQFGGGGGRPPGPGGPGGPGRRGF